jgi:mono/diheme cytochrome c family protein
MPVDITMELLQRGQQRYNIYCAPCHSRVGDGKGTVVEKGVQGGYIVPATNLHEPRLLNVPDGHLYTVISNGIRNMSGYKHQISVADRWAIVAYVRALQRAQHASLADVPENIRKELIKQ